MSLPSQQTIERAQRGDTQALNDLVCAIRPAIQRQLMRYPVSEEDRNDLVQSTLMQVCRRIDSFRGDASFSTWLFRVTANEALMMMRTQRRHRGRLVQGLESDEIDSLTFFGDQPGTSHGDASDRAADIRGALKRLPDSYWQVVSAHYADDLGLNEIAERMNMSESAVRSRLHRARARLREVLGDEQMVAA